MATRKKPAKPKAKTGRPPLDISPEQVEELSAMDCSYAEMAAAVGCDPSTLTRRFAQAIQNGRLRGNVSLRRSQFNLATGGDRTMLIWLGKQRLGQSDKSAHEVTGKDGGPIAVAEVSLTPAERAARLAALVASAKERA